MRLVTYDAGDGARAGVLVGDEIVSAAALDAPADSVRGLLEALDAEGLAALGERAASSGERIARGGVRLLAPVPDPEKIICMGLNYRDHAEEAHQEIPEHPRWFAKFANSLIGDGESQEGGSWEAAMLAGHHCLDNLTANLDNNELQIDGRCCEVVSLGDVGAKWSSFGWEVMEVDGHDVLEICRALDRAEESTCPCMIVAKTV